MNRINRMIPTSRNVVVVTLAASCSSALCAATLIGPLPYLGRGDSPFDIKHPSFVVEDFEDGLFNVVGVASNLGPGSVIGPGGATDSVDEDDGVIDGNGTNGHSFFNGNGGAGVVFDFDPVALGGFPTHAGIVWTDGAGTTSFEAFGADGTSLGVIGPVAIADGNHFGGTGEDRFFGVIEPGGISKIRVWNTSGGIEVDHLQFLAGDGCPKAGPDLNGDGSVGAIDLSLLLGAWGPCGGGCCEADLTGDGEVGAADLAILLGAWG